ncbi:radical SAM protein [Candidatus Kuenenia stuttgartiensis]|uniref:radical SAM protein n=1 Tax=Kuenenia stuttgartiensis TaxID=174633 RepID=UPI00146BFB04|nr:radical SAM protein [Candidatus Kuenenia stuttgartiensis]
MKPIIIPQTYNYIATFLSLACNLRCSYCINYFEEGTFAKKHLPGKDWVRGLNRIVSRHDLPLSLQGGEPSLHKDFIYILNNIKSELNIDILTNLQFDEDEFIQKVDPK